MLADGVDLHDVGVVQPGDGFAFGAEPLAGQRDAGGAEDHLDGDGPVQPELAGAIHDTHAAAAQLPFNDEARQLGRRDRFGRSRAGQECQQASGIAGPLGRLARPAGLVVDDPLEQEQPPQLPTE